MIFNSLQFLIFFFSVLALYYCVQRKGWQLAVLLGSGLVFYGWNNPWLLLLLGACIIINAATSYLLSKISQRRAQIIVAILGVALNLCILAAFKYAHMIVHSLGVLTMLDLSRIEPITLLVNLPLPIGISFFTFEGICLLVDTLRGQTRPGKRMTHLRDTALFISFFPHLVAGPIVRPNQFFPQIAVKNFKQIDWDYVSSNLIIGYFLKMVIADNLAALTDYGLKNYVADSTLNLLVTACACSIRFFSDFAGYSYIALGLAAALGYRLPVNFDWPYRSQSLSEFWTRWHISLSTWLRDYLYLPLGGNRVGKARNHINVMIVMLLGGLWHGAAWNFVAFGGLHGLGLCLERILGWQRIKSKTAFEQTLRTIGVFCYVTFANVFFSMPLRQSCDFLKHLALNYDLMPDWSPVIEASILCLPILLWHVAVAVRDCERTPAPTFNFPKKIAWDFALGTMLFFCLVNPGPQRTFVYFQF